MTADPDDTWISLGDALPAEIKLPLVAEAHKRNAAARERLKAGHGYTPTPADLLEARAWARRGGWR